MTILFCKLNLNVRVRQVMCALFSLRAALLMLLTVVCGGAVAQDRQRLQHLDYTAAELASFMAPGWNLGNTMEAGDNNNVFTDNAGLKAETAWQPNTVSKELIKSVAKNGFKSIRIPVSWVMGHLADSKTMAVDRAWLARVRQIIDWSLESGLFVVVNDHWDGGWIEYDGFTDSAAVDVEKKRFAALWTTLATAFADYDERLVFAGLNEPGVGGASPLAHGKKIDTKALAGRIVEYEQVFVDAVRKTGGKNSRRVLVVQGPNANINDTYNNLDLTTLHDTADRRIMLEIHHYDPYQFTLMNKDEDWGRVWYYWPGLAPAGAETQTVTEKVIEDIRKSMVSLKEKFVDHGIPVIIGEMGANHRIVPQGGSQQLHDRSLARWYEFNVAEAVANGLVPFVWDTGYTPRPCIALFDRKTGKVADSDMLQGVKAGMNAGRKGRK